jgi:RNA polymerase sigma factor (sigma-70 family)
MSRPQKDWTDDREKDQALVIACRRGDEDAWMTVWQRYGPLVKAVARRTGCDSEEARDVVQRVALVALEKLESLRDPKKLAPWLAGIARFQSLEMIRQRRPASMLEEGTAVSDPRYDDEMIRAEDLARLRQAFSQLEGRCQRLLHRLMLKEPPDSYKDVARDEDLSPTSVGPIRLRCMKRLGKLIEKLSRSDD